MPRIAQPPYGHVQNFIRTDFDQRRTIDLRAMVDVEPCGYIYLGSDSSDNELPFLSSASLSEDDDPEHPGKTKKKTRKSGCKERR